MIKVIITILLTLFSVPVFAEPSVIPESTHVNEAANADLRTLISEINSEVDRVNVDDSWGMVDGMTNQGWEYVFWYLNPIDIEHSSVEEIDHHIAYHFALINGMDTYIQSIPQNDVNRRAFFESAVEYMKEWMTVD
jgi:hypothetical protein